MKLLLLAVSTLLTAANLSSALYIPSGVDIERLFDSTAVTDHRSIQSRLSDWARSKMQQAPLRPADQPERNPVSATDGIRLSDILGKTTAVSIFAGFTRQSNKLSALLDGQNNGADGPAQMVVLAPTNAAIASMGRRPWQHDDDGENADPNRFRGQRGQERANHNLERFVGAYLIPTSADRWAEGERVTALGGQQVWYSVENGTVHIQPGNIAVESVNSAATNGQLWVVTGTFPAHHKSPQP